MEVENRLPEENTAEGRSIKRAAGGGEGDELARINELIEQLQSGSFCQGLDRSSLSE